MLRLSVPALLVALAVTSPTRAAETPDPLRCIPASSQVVVKVENPRKLAEAVVALDALKAAQGIPQARAVLDSTTARRLLQMLAYVEQELGAKWPELLDQLAGGGIALGAPLGDNNPPVLVAIQGRDEKQVAKAFDLLIRVADEELTRLGAKERPVRGKLLDHDTVRLGEFQAARVGAAVLVSNNDDALKAGVILAANHKPDAPPAGLLAKKSVQDARKLLPKDPLAWLWVDLSTLKESQAAKDFFASTRDDLFQTLLGGTTIDCVRRSDFVAAGLYQEKTGFRLAVRLPAGRSEFPPEFALHVPPKGEPGSLPLLEPPGVIYSQSFYLDIGYLWKNRDKLINEQTRKQIEEGEQQLSKILPGSVKLGELLEAWGPYHRIVVVNQEKLPYKTEPGVRLPGFAYVARMGDPKFGTGLESIIRSGGVVASLQYNLKMVEETHDGVKVVGWRFSETKPIPEDSQNLRFNYEPCFCTVGDEFVFASSFEVARKIITEIRRTAQMPGNPAVWQGKLYADGAADLLFSFSDPLITETILGEGVGLDEARQQIKDIAAYVRKLGTIRVEIDERDAEYRLDVVWEYKTK
ncbi:MAG TPA: hypothetical protein VKE74_07145 [Gemmataceae bacterium]|nr:hypothetical protein [Gemmataceae bacterium]